MTNCARCGHDLKIHEVGMFHSSFDDMRNLRYGVCCRFEITPTCWCACTAGFDIDVIVEQTLKIDKEHYSAALANVNKNAQS